MTVIVIASSPVIKDLRFGEEEVQYRSQRTGGVAVENRMQTRAVSPLGGSTTMRVRTAWRFATALILVGAALGTAGCVLVPAPVPVAAPVVVAPRPAYGYYGYGYRPYGYWRRY